jgi:1-acyl-sn-glycerol-3-phosphate acyltransferase
MYALMALSGQEYVDIYAATQKARIATGHPAATAPATPERTAPGGRAVPDVQVPVPPEDESPAQ